MDNKYVIGVDIGGTHTRIGAVKKYRELEHFQKHKTSSVIQHDAPVESLGKFLNDYVESTIQRQNVSAISIGFPSVVSKDKRKVHTTTSIGTLQDVDIVDSLGSLLNLPIYIDNDVNHLMMYELSTRNITNDEIVIGIFIGTGLGNSIYINGKLLEGKNGAAAELGHIPIYQVGEACDCGNIGCSEVIASGKRLVSIYETHFQGTEFKDIFKNFKDNPILNDYVKALSIPIATEVNIFDPDLVILGGGVIAMDGFPKEKLEKYILDSCRKPYPATGLNIEYADQVHTAGVLGAVENLFRRLDK